MYQLLKQLNANQQVGALFTLVFGLLLLSSGWRQLLRTITAFTVAHSITLALTAL